MAKFQAGVSGNPRGRTVGSKDKRTEIRRLLEPHQGALVETLLFFAKQGEMTAMRIVMDRLMPPVREVPIKVTIPKIQGADDCTKAQAAVLNAVAAGEMLPGEGQVLSGLIDAQRRAYETSALAKEMQDIRAELDKLKPKESTK